MRPAALAVLAGCAPPSPLAWCGAEYGGGGTIAITVSAAADDANGSVFSAEIDGLTEDRLDDAIAAGRERSCEFWAPQHGDWVGEGAITVRAVDGTRHLLARAEGVDVVLGGVSHVATILLGASTDVGGTGAFGVGVVADDVDPMVGCSVGTHWRSDQDNPLANGWEGDVDLSATTLDCAVGASGWVDPVNGSAAWAFDPDTHVDAVEMWR